MTQDTGGPAFPESGPRGQAVGGEGMTLRDYFAAKAMQGELSAMALDGSGCSGLPTDIPDEVLDKLANHWFRIGSAMLKARG
jgi:hypothetical protein